MPNDGVKSREQLLDELRALRAEVASLRLVARVEVRAGGESLLDRDVAPPLKAKADAQSDTAVRSALRSVHESEQLLAAALGAIQECLAILSAVRDAAGRVVDFRFEYINAAGARNNGRPVDDHLGRTVLELLPGHASGPLVEMYAGVIETGEPLVLTDVVHADDYGSDGRGTRLFDVRIVRFNDGIVATWRDVSDRTQSQSSLRQLIDTIPQFVATAGVDGAIQYLNPRLLAYCGFTLDDLKGDGYQRCVHPDDLEAVRESWRVALATGQDRVVEQRVRRHDGVYRWFRAHYRPFRGDGGAITQWVGTLTDVHDAKQAELGLRDSEARFREMADTMPQIVWTARPDGFLDYYNGRWHEIGGGADAFGDASWMPTIHPDDLPGVVRHWESAVRSGRAMELNEFRLLDARTGEYRWHMGRAVPLRDESGDVRKWIGTTTDVHDLKLAQADAREQRERLEAALVASGTGTFRWNIRSDELTWDANLDRLFGLPPGRTAPSLAHFVSMVHPDDRQGVIDRCWRCRDEGADFDMEFRVVWPDGTVRWLDDKGKTFFDPADGRPAYMTGACVDVTERRRAQDALRSSEARFREMADVMPQIVWTADRDGAVDYFNQRWAEYAGGTIGQAFGDAWADVVHPDDRTAAVERWRHATRTGEPFENEHRYRRHDGTYRWQLVRGVPLRDGAGAVVRWLGTSTDIHGQKLAEQSLREKQEQLALTHQAAGMGAFEWNIRENVTYWSPELEALYGLPPGGFGRTYQTWAAYVFPEDLARSESAIQHAFKDGSYSSDFRVRRADGAVRWMHARARVIHDEEGLPVRMIGINVDITDRKLAEDAARRATEEAERASRAKDEFLAALSHELRTPLTPVLVTAQMLEDDRSLGDDVRHDLGVIRRNVELETRLIDDLLDLTRVSRGKLTLHNDRVDLHAIVRDAMRTCSDDLVAQKRLDVKFEPAAAGHYVHGDAARLSQIFWNLIKNAVKFTPAGGAVVLRSRNPSPGVVEVTVTDTGVGIEPDVLPHVFNAFEQGGAAVTRKFGGLGLGLAICKALAGMHGGSIDAQSDGPGRGATFALRLPVMAGSPERPATSTAAPPSAASTAPRPGGARILLVEDHEQTAKALRRLLANLGYAVEWRASVADALAAAAREPFDLVLSDIGLPDGSGLELMRELRQRHRLSGIALSGYGMEQDLASSAAAGFLEHLVKPISRDLLGAALRRHLA